MRVLILSQCFHGGGAERCARELFEHLPSVGVETELWVGQPAENLPPNVRVIRSQLERCLYPLALLPAVSDWRHFGARRALDQIKPSDFDVVHIHNLHGHWISIEAVKRLCERMPVVWTLHDEWVATQGIPYDLTRVLCPIDAKRQAGWVHPLVLCYPGRHAQRARIFLQTAMPKPAAMIAPSPYLVSLVRQSIPEREASLTKIPYGLTLLNESAVTTDQREARRWFGLPDNKPVVLLIASQLWSPFKGVRFGLNAINRACHQSTPKKRPSVLLLGRGSAQLAKQLYSSINVKTGFATTVNHLAMAYRAADIVIQPSVADNFPYVVLEAFACERPVVAFGVGGLPEMIGANERGLLVEPFNPAMMARAIQELLTDESRRAGLGAAAARWVREQCSMQTYLSQIIAVYRAALAKFS